MPSGEEIQLSLRGFVARWSGFGGSGADDARRFLDELLACYGSERDVVGAAVEVHGDGGGFVDLRWPDLVVVAMKRPHRTLTADAEQVARTRRAAGDPPYVVVCNFGEIEVWDRRTDPDAPVAAFTLGRLPDRYDTLAFLAGESVEPVFVEHHRDLTRRAADTMAQLHTSLVERAAAPLEQVQQLVLRSVWCMFAEDIAMLADFPFEHVVRDVRVDPDRSTTELARFFGGLADQVGGGLFDGGAVPVLERSELDLLATACTYDWRRINPAIFGSLLGDVLRSPDGGDIRASHVHLFDVLKVVGPTILRPWRERIAAATTPQQARDLLDELCRSHVLDPACGCGNFLYVAYRELRGIERELKLTIRRLAEATGEPVPDGPEPFYPVAHLHGRDVEPSAVATARVVLWMGQRQMIDLYGEVEPPLPLPPLPGIAQGDSLADGWPPADFVVGHPPTDTRGWHRLAVDHLDAGRSAGLVGPTDVADELTYVTGSGGVIASAVPSQSWPGDDGPPVSIVSWVKAPTTAPAVVELDGRPVVRITEALAEG